MRLIAAALATISVVIALAAVGISSAETEFVNPSFESGTTAGWDATIPSGGSITVVTDCTGACAGSPSAPYLPVDGTQFALLKTDGPGSQTTLSQTFTTKAGVEITASTFFFDAEGGSPCDSARVAFYVDSVLDTVVFDVGGFTLATCPSTSTPWTSWSFIVPGSACEEVEVTIEARISNIVDDVVDSLLGIDALAADDSACPDATPTSVSTAVPDATATPRSSGGGAGGLSGFISPSQRTAVPSAAAGNSPQSDVAGVQVVGPISPPNTGDAGLAGAHR